MAAITPSNPKAGGKLPVIWLVRVAVSAIVLFIVFRIVPVEQVWAEARRLPPFLWIGALGVFLAGHAAAAAKWRLLIGPGVSFLEAFRAHLAGLGANLALPGVAGGDVVRAGLVYRQAQDKSRLAVGSFADRLLDTIGLAVIAVAGAALASQLGARGGASLVLIAGAGVAAMVGFFGAAVIVDRFLNVRPVAGKIGRLAAKAFSTIAEMARSPGRLAVCLILSMAIQATFIAINIAFADAAQVKAPVAAWFYAWATAKIIAIAPISLGGLGVREASMATLLAPFGANPAQVIAIGLIWQTLLYASGLIGMAVQFFWKPERAASAARPADVVSESVT